MLTVIVVMMRRIKMMMILMMMIAQLSGICEGEKENASPYDHLLKTMVNQ